MNKKTIIGGFTGLVALVGFSAQTLAEGNSVSYYDSRAKSDVLISANGHGVISEVKIRNEREIVSCSKQSDLYLIEELPKSQKKYDLANVPRPENPYYNFLCYHETHSGELEDIRERNVFEYQTRFTTGGFKE
ncbi:hypothetical protein ISS07_00460 [Candidatus Woesearchaeota archaeon]|nr:hypothetical protein [Candidatus Woesearchaeota archaeon]